MTVTFVLLCDWIYQAGENCPIQSKLLFQAAKNHYCYRDLSNNQLTGSIPENISSLAALNTL